MSKDKFNSKRSQRHQRKTKQDEWHSKAFAKYSAAIQKKSRQSNQVFNDIKSLSQKRA